MIETSSLHFFELISIARLECELIFVLEYATAAVAAAVRPDGNQSTPNDWFVKRNEKKRARVVLLIKM